MIFSDEYFRLCKAYEDATKQICVWIKVGELPPKEVNKLYSHALEELRLYLDCNNARMPERIKHYDPLDTSTWVHFEIMGKKFKEKTNVRQ